MKRLIACGVLGLIAIGGLAIAFQGGSKGSGGDGTPESQATGQASQQAEPCAECAQAAKADEYICPLYPYAFHGTYCSYYSTLSPGCMPANYNGPCPPDTVTGGNCNNPAGIPSCIQRAKPQSKPEHGHFVENDVAKGKDAFGKTEVVLEHDKKPYTAKPTPIGGVLKVRYERRKKDGTKGHKAAAEVQAFAVHKNPFDPASQVFVLGTGHEIDPTKVADYEKLPQVTQVIENGAGKNGAGCCILVVGSLSYQVVAVDP